MSGQGLWDTLFDGFLIWVDSNKQQVHRSETSRPFGELGQTDQLTNRPTDGQTGS